jgi:cyclic pyranopterin monophosphate synthase
MSELSHLDDRGKAHMVDVGDKEVTDRTATAEALVALSEPVRRAVFEDGLPKGDAPAVVRLAAIMAAKRTPDLIPLCHPLPLTSIEVEVAEVETGARIVVTAKTTARTGVEMEAMTAAAVGAVTLYDMVKGLDHGAVIGPVRLLEKTGGASGDWQR